jgi:beta-lactamase regulating signal transducer with metallopeptidase domain
MNFLTGMLSPAAMRWMALTLLHFLWQGAALAALAYAGMAFCRSAASRYALGLAMLVMMAAAPAVTYLTLHGQESDTAAVTMNAVNAEVRPAPTASTSPARFAGKGAAAPMSDGVPGYFLWLVELWFAGVMLLGLRSAGGVFVVERMRRKESKLVGGPMREFCTTLQQKMGLQRLVDFYECNRLDAPAVAGWLRPVVMLPVTALTGLSEAQLSSVIAHELAHIKRYDALVNLLQIGVETLLFYHPGVWWLNKKIREERENCCDDMAVEVCGNPLTYAHALARMAESRMSPRLMMAANGRPLAARVARLLGMTKKGETMRGADLSLGLLCLSASLIAGVAFVGVARNVHAQAPVAPSAPVAPKAIQAEVAANVPKTPIAARPEIAPTAVTAPVAPASPVAALANVPAPVPMSAVVGTPQAAPAPAAPQTGSSSYIDGLKAAGLENLSVDDVIALKIQGVTPEYVKSMRDLGLKPDADELVGMKIQGVTPEYVKEMRAATGQTLDMDNLVGMKIQGVTPEYVKQIHDLGIKVDADELVGMKIQGITPEYVQEMRQLGLKADGDELIGMKIQGVTPEYVKSINALGLHPDADELVGMKVQGVDAEYLKKLQAAGIKLDVDEAIGAKVMGVTPEFIEKARAHGFKDLTLEQLIGLKQSGALDEAKH